jgi:hypothetical protein
MPFITDRILSLVVGPREELAALRAKLEIVERELISVKINSDWMRMRVNQLEAERSVLLNRAYPGLNVPSVEIARVANKVQNGFDLQSLFEDQGDEPLLPTAN